MVEGLCVSTLSHVCLEAWDKSINFATAVRDRGAARPGPGTVKEDNEIMPQDNGERRSGLPWGEFVTARNREQRKTRERGHGRRAVAAYNSFPSTTERGPQEAAGTDNEARKKSRKTTDKPRRV